MMSRMLLWPPARRQVSFTQLSSAFFDESPVRCHDVLLAKTRADGGNCLPVAFSCKSPRLPKQLREVNAAA